MKIRVDDNLVSFPTALDFPVSRGYFLRGFSVPECQEIMLAIL